MVGLGKQQLASKVNTLIYFVIGIPLGLLLTFHVDLHETGFWMGLSVAYLAINVFYFTLYKYSDYDKVVAEINARYQYQRI